MASVVIRCHIRKHKLPTHLADEQRAIHLGLLDADRTAIKDLFGGI